jgi:hypothetical protein
MASSSGSQNGEEAMSIYSGKVMNAKVAILGAVDEACRQVEDEGDFVMQPVSRAIDDLIAEVRLELVAYFRQRHQSLTASEIENAIVELKSANVSAATRIDSVVAEGVTLPVGEKPASKCHNGLPHYCPNCDRSF